MMVFTWQGHEKTIQPHAKEPSLRGRGRASGGVRAHDETNTNPSPATPTTPLNTTNGRSNHHATLGQIQKGLGKAQGNRRRGGLAHMREFAIRIH